MVNAASIATIARSSGIRIAARATRRIVRMAGNRSGRSVAAGAGRPVRAGRKASMLTGSAAARRGQRTEPSVQTGSQAICGSLALRLRRIAKPVAPKPNNIMAQVDGSGTAPPTSAERNATSPIAHALKVPLIG